MSFSRRSPHACLLKGQAAARPTVPTSSRAPPPPAAETATATGTQTQKPAQQHSRARGEMQHAGRERENPFPYLGNRFFVLVQHRDAHILDHLRVGNLHNGWSMCKATHRLVARVRGTGRTCFHPRSSTISPASRESPSNIRSSTSFPVRSQAQCEVTVQKKRWHLSFVFVLTPTAFTYQSCPRSHRHRPCRQGHRVYLLVLESQATRLPCLAAGPTTRM